MKSTGNVKNKTKESLVLQHVRSSYCCGHSCQPAVLFETDKSASNMAASVIYNKSEDATTGLSLGCRAPKSFGCCLQMAAAFRGWMLTRFTLCKNRQPKRKLVLNFTEGELIWDKEPIYFVDLYFFLLKAIFTLNRAFGNRLVLPFNAAIDSTWNVFKSAKGQLQPLISVHHGPTKVRWVCHCRRFWIQERLRRIDGCLTALFKMNQQHNNKTK